jgi:hypothetical protein
MHRLRNLLLPRSIPARAIQAPLYRRRGPAPYLSKYLQRYIAEGAKPAREGYPGQLFFDRYVRTAHGAGSLPGTLDYPYLADAAATAKTSPKYGPHC